MDYAGEQQAHTHHLLQKLVMNVNQLQGKLSERRQVTAELEQRNGQLEQWNAKLGQRNAQLEQRNAQLESTNAQLEKINYELHQANVQLQHSYAEEKQAAAAGMAVLKSQVGELRCAQDRFMVATIPPSAGIPSAAAPISNPEPPRPEAVLLEGPLLSGADLHGEVAVAGKFDPIANCASWRALLSAEPEREADSSKQSGGLSPEEKEAIKTRMLTDRGPNRRFSDGDNAVPSGSGGARLAMHRMPEGNARETLEELGGASADSLTPVVDHSGLSAGEDGEKRATPQMAYALIS